MLFLAEEGIWELELIVSVANSVLSTFISRLGPGLGLGEELSSLSFVSPLVLSLFADPLSDGKLLLLTARSDGVEKVNLKL